MATNPKLVRLINLLAQKTLTKEIAWEETADENSFRTHFPAGAVRVSKSLHAGPLVSEQPFTRL